MSKIVNITSKEDKDQKLQDIANSLEELKDVMAEVIEAYEEENADSRKMDTLTEALDALGLLYERDINEGDLVTMDGQHQLWKL